jgi:hypothetical protein
VSIRKAAVPYDSRVILAQVRNSGSAFKTRYTIDTIEDAIGEELARIEPLQRAG